MKFFKTPADTMNNNYKRDVRLISDNDVYGIPYFRSRILPMIYGY